MSDISLKEFIELNKIIEGITLDSDGKLKFDYSKKSDFSMSFGKDKKFSVYKYTESISKVKVFSVYGVKEEKGFPILKGIKRGEAESNDYKHFIKRTAIFISHRILKDLKPDIIITPKSSSFILNDLLDVLEEINPHIKFLSEKIQKVDNIDKIKIDYNHKGISPDIIKSLESIIARAKREGYFQLKWVNKRWAKFISNFFEIVDENKFNKINGKRVIILDDVLSTGTTFQDMIRIVSMYSPEDIHGITIFKSL